MEKHDGLAAAFLLSFRDGWLIFAVMAVRGLSQGIDIGNIGDTTTLAEPEVVQEQIKNRG